MAKNCQFGAEVLIYVAQGANRAVVAKYEENKQIFTKRNNLDLKLKKIKIK